MQPPPGGPPPQYPPGAYPGYYPAPGQPMPPGYPPGMAPGYYPPPMPGQPMPGYGMPGQPMPPGMPPGAYPGMAPAPMMPHYPAGIVPPTPLSPADAEDATRRIYNAFRGIGTDNTEFINCLSSYNRNQLAQISSVYFQRYGKTLEAAIRGEISGAYRDLAIAMIKPPLKMEASWISSCLKTPPDQAVDLDCLAEILGTRSSADLQMIAQYYQMTESLKPGKPKKSGKAARPRNFVNDLLERTKDSKDMNGWFRALLTNQRPVTPADAPQAERDARDLIAAARGMGTDERVFFEVMSRRSYPHLLKVSDELARQKKKDLVKLIESEFSSVSERALVITAMRAKSPGHAQAYILYRAMKGAGTADDRLIRSLAYIYDNPLRAQTIAAYQEMYKKDLLKEVASETSFNYKKLALAMLGFKGTEIK